MVYMAGTKATALVLMAIQGCCFAVYAGVADHILLPPTVSDDSRPSAPNVRETTVG
jgi:hypothetical protein